MDNSRERSYLKSLLLLEKLMIKKEARIRNFLMKMDLEDLNYLGITDNTISKERVVTIITRLYFTYTGLQTEPRNSAKHNAFKKVMKSPAIRSIIKKMDQRINV